MTSKRIQNIQGIGLIFLLFILLVGTTYAEEVIFQTTGAAVSQYYTSPSTYAQTCAGNVITDTITVKNQGTLSDSYALTLVSSTPEILQWVALSETSFSLQPGEQKNIVSYISAPYSAAGTYTYTVHVTSLYDSTKDIEKTLTINQCPNIDVRGYPASQTSCPCTTAVYVFSVTNTGPTTETYSLHLKDMDPAYYELSEYVLRLQPHETKEVYAYTRMACFVYGDFDFTLIAETQNSNYIAELPLSLYVQQACYNYNIALGNAQIFSENESLVLDFTETTDTNYVFCQETPAVIPIQIQNPGDIINEYSLKIEDAEDWISVAEPYIRLTKNKEHITSIVVNTAAADTGIYSFALKAETLRGDLESVIPFTVEVQDCTIDGMPAWVTYALWTLLSIVLLAIIVAGYYLLKKPESKPAETIKKHKKWIYTLLPLLLLFLLIGLFAYPQVKELYGTSTQSIGEMWNTVETVFYNWATALILLGALLLLGLLLWYFKLRKKKSKKSGKNKISCKEKCTALYEKFKPFLKWIWILLLLLILLGALSAGGYYLYTNYKQDADKFSEKNNTEVINGSDITETINDTEDTESMDSTLEESDDDSDNEITELQEQLTAVQEQIADKEQEITALQEELLRLAEEAAAQENATTIEEYEERIQELLDKIVALEEQLTALQQQETQLLAALGTLDSKINAVDSHVTDLEERIAELEEQITALQHMIAQLTVEQVNETILNPTQKEIEELTEEKQDLEIILIPVETVSSEDVPVITDDLFETTLIFDVSISGQIVEQGMTRFQRGVEAAEKYVQEKGIYNVMIIGKNPIMIKRDANRRDTMRTIHLLRPLDTQSNLGSALYRASEDFNDKKGRIVLISDMQTTDNTHLAEIHDILEEQGFDVVFIDISSKEVISLEEPEQTTEEQLAPYFSVETQTASSFQIDIPMNSDYSVDLNKYFSDEDQDILTYTVEAGEHLYAAIKEDIAILSPERDWSGKTTVVFGADDTKGGFVQSPAFVVNVFEFTEESTEQETQEVIEKPTEEEKEKPKEDNETEHSDPESSHNEILLKTYIPWIIIGSIIFLIVASVIIGAFVRRFQKP